MVDIQGATGGEHKLAQWLLTAELGSTGQILLTPGGYLFGWGTTVGNGVENWSVSAIFLDTDAATDNQLNLNVGTATTASWEKVTSA